MQLITKSIVKNRFHYIKNILLSQVVIVDTTPKTSCTFNGQNYSGTIPQSCVYRLAFRPAGEFFCLVPFFPALTSLAFLTVFSVQHTVHLVRHRRPKNTRNKIEYAAHYKIHSKKQVPLHKKYIVFTSGYRCQAPSSRPKNTRQQNRICCSLQNP
jgi:hypothetical protein